MGSFFDNFDVRPPWMMDHGQYPFGGISPGALQNQQSGNWGCYHDPLQQLWPVMPSKPEDLRQVAMWKCGHCGSRFHDQVEKCKNCGSTAILRFDDPGEGARQMTPEERLRMMDLMFAPMGIFREQQQTMSEAVAEFREEVAAITGSRQPGWLSRCWSRFVAYLDRCGYREGR